MHNGPRQVWKDFLDPSRFKQLKDLLDPSGFKEPMVSQDDLEDVVSLMIDNKIDPSKFAGNLRALLSGGTGILSFEDAFFPEKTWRPSPTQSMTREFIFGRPTGTPLWMLAAFPDVVNWLNDKMIDFHRTSNDECDEDAKFLLLFGIELKSAGDLDESAFENKEGQMQAKYFRNLIDNFAKDTGKTFETSVEDGSPNDIYLGFELFKSLGEENLFTLIASTTTKYYLELKRNFAKYFPDETSLIAAAGIIDANHYIFKTQQIKPEEIIDLARETRENKNRFIDFMMCFEPLIMSAEGPEFPVEMVKESCESESEAIERAILKTLTSYTNEQRIADWCIFFMKSPQFSSIRKTLHVRDRSLLRRIKEILFGQ